MMLERPCTLDPISWDTDAAVGAPHPPVDQLVRSCLIDCPALEWCTLNADPDTFGVVAGQYRPWPDDDRFALTPTVRKAVDSLTDLLTGLNPGDKIPPTRVLAQRWRMSRSSVRAGLRWLAGEDVLLLPTSHTGPYRVAAPPRKDQAA